MTVEQHLASMRKSLRETEAMAMNAMSHYMFLRYEQQALALRAAIEKLES